MTTSDETELAVRGEESNALERRTPGTVAATGTEETAEPPAVRSDDGGSDADDPASDRGGRRRRPVRTVLLVVVAIAVAAAAGMAASGTFGSDGEDSANTVPSGPPATTKVQRTTLTDTETVDGNLSYGDATDVQAPASSAGTGSGSGQQGSGSGSTGAAVITWLPTDGIVLERGDTVYRVGQEKVPLLYGSIPLYRALETGNEGEDVKILEKNLKALGYTGFTVDDTYTSDTADAVKEWQEDLDREETGTVQIGDAVVASGARRVAEVKSVPGALLSGGLLSWTGTARVVNVDLDPQYEDLVKKGTKATVTLPDDTTVDAVVTDVGTPPPTQSGSGSDSGQQSEGGSDTATIPVQLEIKDQKKLGRYQAAQVDVVLKAETRENVLAVPVNALTAQRGGYALEAVTDKGVEYVPVKLGMFAGSLVEVTGAAVKEGMVVGVPK